MKKATFIHIENQNMYSGPLSFARLLVIQEMEFIIKCIDKGLLFLFSRALVRLWFHYEANFGAVHFACYSVLHDLKAYTLTIN